MKQPRQMRNLIPLATCSLLVGLPVGAEEAGSVDKSQYHLFNPTPRTAMREMSTDRPDKTESAYTVDAGHFQIEMDLVTYSHDHEKSKGTDVTVDAFAVAPINLKAGLCNRVDLQVILQSYLYVRTEDRASNTRIIQRGLGDIATRLKVNLWGNDQGKSALSAMPFVKLPTNQDELGNNSVEGGLIFPFALALPGGWGLGAMTEFDCGRNGASDGYHAEFVNTLTFSHDIVGDLGGYVEFWSLESTESGSDWMGTVDFGFTYALTEDIQLDGGVNIGVTDSADNVNPFLGLSLRF